MYFLSRKKLFTASAIRCSEWLKPSIFNSLCFSANSSVLQSLFSLSWLLVILFFRHGDFLQICWFKLMSNVLSVISINRFENIWKSLIHISNPDVGVQIYITQWLSFVDLYMVYKYIVVCVVLFLYCCYYDAYISIWTRVYMI